jgi:predicted nucleotidyltransferase
MQTSQLERIRQLISESAPAFLDTRPVLLSYLYGSCARGDVHVFSDIDIAVYLEETNPQKMLDIELGLALDFDAILDAGNNVDVRSLNHMSLMMKGNIVTEGILLYSRYETFRIEFETIVRKAYFDFKPFIHRYHQAYLTDSLVGA